MKNLLISLASIICSFFVTTFILNQFNTKNSITNTIEEKQEVIASDNHSTETEETINESLEGLEEDTNSFLEPKKTEETTNEPATTNSGSLDFSNALADYNTWKAYNKENIDLATDFIAVDINGSEITKDKFLEELKTGNYVPKKLYDAEYMYQLYKIDTKNNEKISKTIKTSSNVVYNYFAKENKAFPEFDFTDINGNSYTSKNTKGNILVIECWFVQCTQCIQEIPQLNNLYDRYESHDDIIFLSLVFDKTEKIKKFLSKKEYRYPVIPDQKNFIKNDLGVIQYPTHLIIDKYGDIKKMVNNVDSLILALDTMVNGELIPDEM